MENKDAVLGKAALIGTLAMVLALLCTFVGSSEGSPATFLPLASEQGPQLWGKRHPQPAGLGTGPKPSPNLPSFPQVHPGQPVCEWSEVHGRSSSPSSNTAYSNHCVWEREDVGGQMEWTGAFPGLSHPSFRWCLRYSGLADACIEAKLSAG